NPFVGAVARVPANVHTKLLVGFVGTAVLVVAVALLGLRVLGESNARMGTLGALQKRAAAYGQLQSDTGTVRGLLAENVGSDYYKVNVGGTPRGRSAVTVDLAVVNQLARIRAATFADRLGFAPPAEDEDVLRRIRSK